MHKQMLHMTQNSFFYPCFGLLGTSALGFQAQVDPHLYAFSPGCNGFLRFTSGATPADFLTASMAAGHILYMHVKEVGSQ